MQVLNYRERQVIHYVAEGYTAKEIARLVGLEHRTVESYVGIIRKKLAAKNVAHAVYIASLNNILGG